VQRGIAEGFHEMGFSGFGSIDPKNVNRNPNRSSPLPQSNFVRRKAGEKRQRKKLSAFPGRLVFLGETMPESDASLLKSFAATRDEKTFRVLADRYLGLIFHTAVRRTGNRPLSEEVSQNVLCAMAKKAGALAKNPERLAAWLHRATILESLKAMRSEASHQRRKQLLHPDAAAAALPAESIWSDAVPILDGALDKLPEADRTVLLLHFFENQTFPQIARSLGKSAEAVQKQSRRALEKLSRLLRARGVALSATALVTGLTSEMAKAAPLQLAGIASANAFAAAGSSSDSITAMITSHPKALVPVTLLICALPLAVQQIAISKAASRHDELLARQATSQDNPMTGARPLRRQTAGTSSPGGRGTRSFSEFSKQWDEARRAQGNVGFAGTLEHSAFRRLISSLDSLEPAELIGLIREGAAARMDKNVQYPALGNLIAALAKRDPRLALDTALAELPAGSPSFSVITWTGLGRVLGNWTKQDPQAALDWFLANHHSSKLAGLQRGFNLAENDIGTMAMPLASALISRDPALARQVLELIPMGKRGEFLGSLQAAELLAGAYSHQEATQHKAPSPRDAAALIELGREFAPMSVGNLASGIVMGSFPSAAFLDGFASHARLSDEEKITVAREILKSSGGATFAPDGTISRRINENRERLARQFAGERYDQLVEEGRKEIKQREAETAMPRIDMLRRRESAGDDEIYRTLLMNDFSSVREAALEQAERIKDPDKRAKAIQHINSTEP